MSVSYDRVNWADYPATTTPVNATNLNKMDKGIADLTREVNSVESDMSDLNSSLDNIDVRYTSANGAEWSPRGAGTWRPFSSYIARKMAYSLGRSTSIVLPRKATYLVTWANPANLQFSGNDIIVDENYGWYHTGPGMAYGEGLAIITSSKDNATVNVTGWSGSYGGVIFVLELESGFTIKDSYDMSASMTLPNGTYVVVGLGGHPTLDETNAVYKYQLGLLSGNSGSGDFVYGCTIFYCMEVYNSPVTFTNYTSVSKVFRIK